MSTPTPLARAKVHPQWKTFRFFCDLARRPRRQTSLLRKAPWDHLPRVLPFLPDDPTTLTSDQWVQASTAFLDSATNAQLEALPENLRRSSTVWVVRRNNIDGEILEALVDEVCDRHGRPYRIDQIKKMKQRGIAELFLWAMGSEASSPPEEPATTAASDADEPSNETRPRPRLRWLVTLLGIALAGGLLWMRPGIDRPPPRYLQAELYAGWEGRAFPLRELPEIQTILELPPHPLPALGFQMTMFRILPPVDGSGPKLLFSPLHGDVRPGRVVLWNPVTGRIEWENEFVPPPDQILTHASLDSTALEAPFAAATVLAGRAIPDRILVTFHNDFSPSFAVQLDRETGEIRSYYAHPGRLESGLVLDLTGHGQGRFVLIGHENVFQRPVVLSLPPSDENLVAATVQWNPTGEEGVEARCLLPDARDLQEAAGLPRLQARPLVSRDWAASRGRLRLDVWVREGEVAYTAYVDSTLEVANITLGESTIPVWRDHGIDPESAQETLGEPILFRRGEKGPVALDRPH